MKCSLRVFDCKALLEKSKTLCYASKYFENLFTFSPQKNFTLEKAFNVFFFFLNFIIFSCPALFREKNQHGNNFVYFLSNGIFQPKWFSPQNDSCPRHVEMCWDVSQLSIWIHLSGLRTTWRDWNVSGLSFQFVRAHRLSKLSLWLLNIFCYFFTIPIRRGAGAGQASRD